MYRLHWWPDLRKNLHGTAFAIYLKTSALEKIAKSELNQEKIDNFLRNSGDLILKCHGYDNKVFSYRDLRIEWDEKFGVRYIRVPGNACELSMTEWEMGQMPDECASLTCHNMDQMRQASMCLTIYTEIMNMVDMGI